MPQAIAASNAAAGPGRDGQPRARGSAARGAQQALAWVALTLPRSAVASGLCYCVTACEDCRRGVNDPRVALQAPGPVVLRPRSRPSRALAQTAAAPPLLLRRLQASWSEVTLTRGAQGLAQHPLPMLWDKRRGTQAQRS